MTEKSGCLKPNSRISGEGQLYGRSAISTLGLADNGEQLQKRSPVAEINAPAFHIHHVGKGNASIDSFAIFAGVPDLPTKPVGDKNKGPINQYIGHFPDGNDRTLQHPGYNLQVRFIGSGELQQGSIGPH